MITATPQLQDDEIDLRELGAALLRRWSWLAGFTLAGVLLGAASGLKQPPQQSWQLLVNLNQGPLIQAGRLPLENPQSPQSIENISLLKPLQSAEEVQVALTQALNRRSEAKDWQVEQFKLGRQMSSSLIVVRQTGFVAEPEKIKSRLEKLASAYRDQLKGLSLLYKDVEPAKPSWIEVVPQDVEASHPGRAIALGGLAGLVLGAGAALVADRRANRVYGVHQLIQLMGYPLRASLPVLPWHSEIIEAQVSQLAVLLEPNLQWLVLSVAQPHPVCEALVQGLKRHLPAKDLAAGPVLLREPLQQVSEGQPLGVLCVIQPGFNSVLALEEARRLLDQLPFVQEVGLVLVGQSLPDELRS